MLTNKFFIGILAILLVLVVVYNWKFFSQKNADYKKTVSGPSPLTPEPLSSLSHRPGEGVSGETLSSQPTDVSNRIKDEWKNLLTRQRWGRNPFLTPSEAGYFSSLYCLDPGSDIGKKADTISAILMAEGDGIAIINHQIVSKGDWIGGEQIEEIKPDRVLFDRGGRLRTIIIKESPVIVTLE